MNQLSLIPRHASRRILPYRRRPRPSPTSCSILACTTTLQSHCIRTTSSPSSSLLLLQLDSSPNEFLSRQSFSTSTSYNPRFIPRMYRRVQDEPDTVRSSKKTSSSRTSKSTRIRKRKGTKAKTRSSSTKTAKSKDRTSNRKRTSKKSLASTKSTTSSNSNESPTNTTNVHTHPKLRQQWETLRKETTILHQRAQAIQSQLVDYAHQIHLPEVLLTNLLCSPIESTHPTITSRLSKKVHSQIETDYKRRLSTPDINLTHLLLATEKDHVQLCSKLRQLVAGWASLRTQYQGRRGQIAGLFPIPIRTAQGKMVKTSDTPSLTTWEGNGPAYNAEFYLGQLEDLRRIRVLLWETAWEGEKEAAELMRSASPTYALKQLLPSGVANLFGGGAKDKVLSEGMENLKRLTAHTSANCATNTTLYKEVLRSHLYWEYMNNSSLVSWSTLVKHLKAVLKHMEKMHHAGNPHTKPDRESIHLLLQGAQNCHEEFSSLQSCADFLLRDGSMLEEEIAPSTYMILLSLVKSSMQRMGKSSAHFEKKRRAVEMAMKLLQKVENLNQDPDAANKEGRAQAYNTTLQIIQSAGEDCLPDYFDRIDSLMENYAGKERYRRSIDPFDSSDGLGDQIYDWRILESLIEIFARASEGKHIERAKKLLELSIQARHVYMRLEEKEEQKAISNAFNWDQKYPRLQSVISVLSAIVPDKYDWSQPRIEPTKENTLLFTSLYEYIRRDRCDFSLNITFFHLFLRAIKCEINVNHLGSHSSLGSYAESVLDDMELDRLCSPEMSPTPETYRYIFDCWAISAAEGKGDSVEKAHDLLKRMEASLKQSGLKWDKNNSAVERELDDIYGNKFEEKNSMARVYFALLKVCSSTSHAASMEYALDLAFDSFQSMEKRGIPLMPRHYAELLHCCTFENIDRAKRLDISKTIFSQARDEVKASKLVLSNLEKANYALFQIHQEASKHARNG